MAEVQLERAQVHQRVMQALKPTAGDLIRGNIEIAAGAVPRFVDMMLVERLANQRLVEALSASGSLGPDTTLRVQLLPAAVQRHERVNRTARTPAVPIAQDNEGWSEIELWRFARLIGPISHFRTQLPYGGLIVVQRGAA